MEILDFTPCCSECHPLATSKKSGKREGETVNLFQARKGRNRVGFENDLFDWTKKRPQGAFGLVFTGLLVFISGFRLANNRFLD